MQNKFVCSTNPGVLRKMVDDFTAELAADSWFGADMTAKARVAEALRALVSAARRLLLHPGEIDNGLGVCGNLDLYAPNQLAYYTMHFMGKVWPNSVHSHGGYWADGCEWNTRDLWVGKGGERRMAVLVDTIAVFEKYLKEQR